MNYADDTPDHSHSLSGNTGNQNPGTDSAHTHTVSGTTDSASGTTGTANPPFIALNFIIYAGV
jgi:hypothetical protein